MHKRDYVTKYLLVVDPLCLHSHFEILNAPPSSGDYSARINFVFRERIPSHFAHLLHALTVSRYKAKITQVVNFACYSIPCFHGKRHGSFKLFKI